MEKQPKRPRKANFTETEVRVLLEEINLEHHILFMANTQAVINISACGVAVRSPQEVKDKWRALKGAVLNKWRALKGAVLNKWRALKGAVLNKQRQQGKTGG